MAVWKPLLLAALAAAVPLARAEWPGKDVCKQRYLSLNFSECDVLSRADLPSFREDAEYEVFALSHPIAEGGLIAELMAFTHTAIGLRARHGTEEILLEFWALNFSTAVVVPDISNGQMHWSNEAVLTWLTAIDHTVWVDSTSLGVTNGSVVNKFMDWLPTWQKQHKYYELWSAWSEPQLGSSVQRFYDDSTCNRFTEDAIWQMHRLGASLSSDVLLCRNYFTFITNGPLQPVVGTLAHVEMRAYYESFGAIVAKLGGRDLGIKKLLEVMAMAFVEKHQPRAFIYDRDSDTYSYVNMVKPYLELWPMYIAQRMVLPWQTVDAAVSKECDPWTFAGGRSGAEKYLVV